MASVNKVILVGNLGRDPEMRSFPSGDQIANVTLATTDQWKDKQTGERREHTEWHRLVFNGKLAEVAAQYLRKGSQVYIEGALRTRKWQDKDTGKDCYATEIRVDQMKMLGKREDGAGSAASAQTPAPAAQRKTAAPAPQAQKSSNSGGFGDMDDDIPF